MARLVLEMLRFKLHLVLSHWDSYQLERVKMKKEKKKKTHTPPFHFILLWRSFGKNWVPSPLLSRSAQTGANGPPFLFSLKARRTGLKIATTHRQLIYNTANSLSQQWVSVSQMPPWGRRNVSAAYCHIRNPNWAILGLQKNALINSCCQRCKYVNSFLGFPKEKNKTAWYPLQHF